MNEWRQGEFIQDSLRHELGMAREELKASRDQVQKLMKSIGDREDEISYLGHKLNGVKMKLDSLGK